MQHTTMFSLITFTRPIFHIKHSNFCVFSPQKNLIKTAAATFPSILFNVQNGPCAFASMYVIIIIRSSLFGSTISISIFFKK